jgi:predicted dehydrogenase
VPLAEAPGLYAELARGAGGIGTVITYPGRAAEMPAVVKLAPVAGPRRGSGPVIGVIGAGSFATRTILPLLARSGARCKVIASRGGTEAAVAGRRFGFEQAASDAAQVLDDEDVNVVFILTSHSSHAGLACDALARGKHVFVEKPLAITAEHLAQVKAAYAEAAGRQGGPPQFHVGFNRRFAPHVCRMKEFLAREPGPKCLMAMVNAGAIDRGHWADDPRVGGGRIVGEACHFVDLLRFLAGAKIEEVKATPRGKAQGQQRADDSVTITVSLADGSTGTVHYWADGSRAYPKERVEVFSGGKVLVLDNFRRLTGYGWPGFRRMRSWWGQDKGHRTEVREFLRRVQEGGPPLIPFDELVEVTEACLLAAGAL